MTAIYGAKAYRYPAVVEAEAEEWTRPDDWLALPALVDGNQKVVGLFAVWNHGSNYVAILCRGAYTVDWGDGDPPENVADNVQAEHLYTYSDFASSTDCSRGYRQAIVTITPQSGSNLTQVYFDRRHSDANAANGTTGWLDVAAAGQNITHLSFYSANVLWSRMLEQFTFVGTLSTSWTSMSGMFGYCYSLQSVPLFNTASVTSMYQMFNACYSLQSVPLFNTASVTSMYQMFNSCYSLQSVPLFNTASVTSMYQMFIRCYSLQSVPLFNTASVTNMGQMFNSCYSLQSVPLFNTASVTSMGQMFNSCYSLQSVPLFNTASVTSMVNMFNLCYSLGLARLNDTNITHDFSNCKLSRQDLLNIFGGASHNVPDIESTGELTTRTNDTEGTITLDAPHLVAAGAQTLDLTWSGGARTGITGTRGTGANQNTLTITGGAGDNLPAATTAITVSYAYHGLRDMTGETKPILTITGNPGVADLTAGDKLEATDKNWTLVE